MDLDADDEMLLQAIAEKYGFSQFLIIGQMADDEGDDDDDLPVDTMCIINSRDMTSHDMMRYMLRGMQLMMGYLAEGTPTAH